jgi:hypothetical protein
MRLTDSLGSFLRWNFAMRIDGTRARKVTFERGHFEWVDALKIMGTRDYWGKANTVEFFAFVVKAIIIVPGLLFETQWWWLYLFAMATSVMLIWSSTVKTIPTLIWFNLLWIVLSGLALVKNFP